ncbi:MAG TPA: M28 family peptidase [Gemmatimonadaceae bacterium]|nr:M28 family peptidase [Gemmatimonadaceae bacterium]
MHRPLTAALIALVPAILGAQVQQGASTVVPQPATKLPLKHVPQPTSAEISAKDLMTRLYIFADDSMQGREAGTIGNVKGTDYIASEVKRFGLKPAGDNGTYFQTIPFKTRSTDSTSTLTAGGESLAYGKEWGGSGAQSLSNANLSAIYGGNAGDAASLIDPSMTAGKLVVIALPTGPTMFQSFRNVQKYGTSGAAAVAVIVPPMLLPFVTRPAQFLDDRPEGAPVPPATIFVTPEAAAKLFDTPLAQLATGAAGKTVSVDLKINTAPTPYPARNVVAILPGRDAKLAGEYVAMGAHNDHVGFNHTPVDHDSLRIFNHIVRPGGAENQGAQATPDQQAEVNKELAAWRGAHPNTVRPDSIDNGADDDGSGSVSVLEIAQKMASLRGAARPKRSILFVWHVGEEKGLLGSTYFTDHPTVPRDSIVAQLNMDMVGRGDAWDMTGLTKDGKQIHGNENYLQLVGSRRLSTELGDLIEKVNTDDHHGFVFDYSLDADNHPANIYCRSDHYEYARYGIPITFFTTGGHSDYHQVTDEPEYIDYDHMARIDKLVEDVAMHVANLDHRVVVDHAKPDPHGVCKQ